MSLRRIAVLGSTRGTHLLTLIEAIKAGQLNAELACVISNRADAGILEKAALAHLKHFALLKEGQSREAYDQALDRLLVTEQADIIVLIGFMRILSAAFTTKWANKIINIHPSLLPKHAGLMDLDVHQAVLDAAEIESGCTAHIVTKDVDCGPILAQETCPVLPDDTAESLKARVQSIEAKALISGINKLLT